MVLATGLRLYAGQRGTVQVWAWKNHLPEGCSPFLHFAFAGESLNNRLAERAVAAAAVAAAAAE